METSTSWTLDEYVLRVELAEEPLREVVVEGPTDRAFFEDVLERYELDDVVVLDSAYVTISDDEVREAGYSTGVKGALLTLATRLRSSAAYAANDALIVVVVDRDFDGIPDGCPAEFVLMTDYYSLEGYALTRSALERFVRRVLVRERRPPGPTGSPPGDRNACSGSDLLDRLLPACGRISAVRLVLRELDQPVAAISGWTDYFQVSPDGRFEVRANDLLKATLEPHKKELDGVSERFIAALATAEREPRLTTRGRDFIRLLHKLLKSSWGRRMSSVNFAVVDEPTLTTWVLASVASTEVDSEPLFVALRDRLQIAA